MENEKLKLELVSIINKLDDLKEEFEGTELLYKKNISDSMDFVEQALDIVKKGG